jgi:hypothetical protein
METNKSGKYKGVVKMSELKVKENKFYILTKKDQKGKEQWIYIDIDNAVKHVKEYLKIGIEGNNLELVSVEMKEDRYVIQTIPWGAIASKLVKE